MKRHYKRRTVSEVLKILNLRQFMNYIFKSQSVRDRYLGIFWGLYISGFMTFSSYSRLETLINKIEDKKLISLRKIS
jgi:hypothetical protein